MATISVGKNLLGNMKRKYTMLPKNSMEFGGLLCGFSNNDRIFVKKIVDVPSSLGSKDGYYFNRNVIKSQLCSPFKVMGMWHTHPKVSPFPSDLDRSTTERLKMVGCVLTNSLKCFQGNSDLRLQVDI